MAGDLTLHIDTIKGDPHNVRTQVSLTGIKELAQSIKSEGLLNPIIVRPVDDAYVVVAGHRRLAAIGQLVDAGEHDGNIDAIVATISEADVTVAQLVENLQREDIDAIDEANGYARLLTFDMSQADIARRVGRSRAHVTKRLALLTVPEQFQKALRKGDLTIEGALTIAALDDEGKASLAPTASEYDIARALRASKGRKAAAKMTEQLEALCIEVQTIDVPVSDLEAPEGQRWETAQMIHSDTWDGVTLEEDGITLASVEVSGDQARGRLFRLVERSVKAEAKEAKREDAEKEQRKAERLAKRAETDHLVASLRRVKATDLNDLMLNHVLGSIGFSDAREVCAFLDLEVEVKTSTGYDGKERNEKQYHPAVRQAIAEAEANGDIGELRRIAMAWLATRHRKAVLDLYGYGADA